MLKLKKQAVTSTLISISVGSHAGAVGTPTHATYNTIVSADLVKMGFSILTLEQNWLRFFIETSNCDIINRQIWITIKLHS